MTNRARPTWPDGADTPNPQRPPAGSGTGKSTPPGTPASNGRSSSNGSGQPRTGTANGQRPGNASQPRPGGPAPVTPSRPPQQPPVRPASNPYPAASAPATAPSTPGRPEQRLPSSGGAPGASAYGQVGKVATPTHTPAETFGDKLNAAKQAVLGRATALKESATQSSEPKAKVDKRADLKPADARTTATEPVAKTSSRPQTRKARLRLTRLDPWSVMKTAFLLAIAFGIVTWVAVFIVWSAIGAAGVFENINNTVREVLGTQDGDQFQIQDYINTGKVMGFTTLLACADVLIITALATLGSFLYNIAATLLGGLEVTLASED